MPTRLRIREARLAAGLTQDAAAEKAGLHQQYWSGLETGGYPNPTIAMLRKIAKALGCEVSDLLGE